MNRFLKGFLWSLLGLIVLLLVAVVVARMLFTRYLHSEAFRHTLAQGAAGPLHASSADFAPFDFDGSIVYSGNFNAQRSDGGGFSSINADQLRATFDWHGLLSHTVQIDELAVQRLSIEPPTPGAVSVPPDALENAPTPAPLSAGRQGWKVDLRKAAISEANWNWSDTGGISGAALTLTPESGGDGWIIEAQGGAVKETGWPDLTLENATMRWRAPTLYINSSTLRSGASQLNVTGSVETRKACDLHLQFTGVDVQPFLSRDWRERLSGRLNGNASIHAPLDSPSGATTGHDVTVSGSLTLIDGHLTALPVLDEIGVFTHTERFRQVDLTRASADFTRTDRRIEVRNLILESEGLIRVEGDYTVENGRIDGSFHVGLTSETLQWIPGSQEQVFTDSRDGYRWTTMRLTGPVNHPRDDLTARLAAAAGNEVIQNAEGVEGTVKKAAQGALDLLLH